MFDKEAIQTLAEATSIAQAVETIQKAMDENKGVAALPSDYKIHDFESFGQLRRRMRGTMSTRYIAPFVEYTQANKSNGATVFVNPDDMTATAVLDLGTPDLPGHADNKAKLTLCKTAAFDALLRIAAGQRTQREIAEFLEDWLDIVTAKNSDGEVKKSLAIAAIRKITIDSTRKVESDEQALSTTRSAFESVQASSKDPLPTFIEFTCTPYADLAKRTFVLRLSVITTEREPRIQLRIQRAEEHTEQMANELVGMIDGAIDSDIPVLVGCYGKGA